MNTHKKTSPYEAAAQRLVREMAHAFGKENEAILIARLKENYPSEDVLQDGIDALLTRAKSYTGEQQRRAQQSGRTMIGWMFPPGDRPHPAGSDKALPLAERVSARQQELAHTPYIASAEIQVQAGLEGRAPLLEEARQRAQAARTAPQKMYWLRQTTRYLGKATVGHTACRPQCTTCCHWPVLLAADEARVIAAETGASLAEPRTEAVPATGPCTFLRDGRCQIYAARPYACRTRFNLDADSLLCEAGAVDGPVSPFFDDAPWKAHYLQALATKPGEAVRLADIRVYFPKGLG